MTKIDILNSLKQLSNLERLEIIEFASHLIHEEMQEEILTSQIKDNFNQNSAEGKALSRINTPINDDEWIIVDNIDQEIDMEKIKEQFIKSGYKSKIFTEKTSFN